MFVPAYMVSTTWPSSSRAILHTSMRSCSSLTMRMRAISSLPSALMLRLRKRKPKVAAPVLRRLRANRAALCLYGPAGDRKAEPRSGLAVMGAAEGQENRTQLLLGEPIAAISHMNAELARIIFNRDFDSSLVRELDR